MIDGVVGNKFHPARVRYDIMSARKASRLSWRDMTKALLESGVRKKRTGLAASVPLRLWHPRKIVMLAMARFDRLGPAKEVARLAHRLCESSLMPSCPLVATKPEPELSISARPAHRAWLGYFVRCSGRTQLSFNMPVADSAMVACMSPRHRRTFTSASPKRLQATCRTAP